ncbi:MAG: N-6 DNA methylase [Promethearchaeota archaeon]
MLKKDLIKATNLKNIFTIINQHLYAKLKYVDTDTRARSREIINLLLIKLVDEINKSPDEELDFYIRDNETDQELLERLQISFRNNVRNKYPEIIAENELIGLNAELLSLIVKELQHISLLKSSKDIFADAFEIFVSKILKEEGGQFFTPMNIIKFMINYLDPEIDSKILDPACGHGGFLLEAKDFLWKKIDKQAQGSDQKKRDLISNLHGIEKDLFLVKICKLYLEILSGGVSNIVCENSLDPESYRSEAQKLIKNNHFDYIFTNPPFGSKIPIDDKKVLELYNLGHVWKSIGESKWKMHSNITSKKAPQILFIERCVQLLNKGGKLGIILPEGLFGNPSDRNIWEYLKSKGKILGIISLNQNTFQPYTCNKTSILFFQKLNQIPQDYNINFAIVNNVGHDKDGKILFKLNKDGTKKLDSEGNPIINDDLIDLYKHIKNSEDFDYHKEQLVFNINLNQIKNNIFIPYYYTGVEKNLKNLAENKNYVLFSIKDLIEKKILYTKNSGYLPRGDEIGSHVYGLGEVPFIRTSDINNWEINLESHKKTSEEIYELYKQKQNLEKGDILLVKDGGPNLIGKTGYITELDTKIIIQSHIYQLKILKNDEDIDSYLLLYLLNLDIVQKQIQAITFIQGTIATIGNRIMDVILPIPKNKSKRQEISQYIKDIIENKIEIRKKINKLSIDF